jgi:hypothetical protein
MATDGRLIDVPVSAPAERFGDNAQLAAAAGAVATGALLGAAVAAGAAVLVVAAAVGLAALAIAVLRPEALMIGWFAAILVDGRWLTYHQVGPLYVTEPLLALLVFGVLAGILVGIATGRTTLQERAPAVRFVLATVLVMLVPALVGLMFETNVFDYATGRNLLLILYPLFALLVVCVTDLRHTYKYWFAIAIAGPALALVLVVSGLAGEEGSTSTGAVRVASYTFALAFGIAPIVAIAAARERLLSPLWATTIAVPSLVALVLVNHRSAWLAFIAAAAILVGRRISPAVVVGSLAAVVVGFLLLTGPVAGNSTLGQEIKRAKTVTSTTDPNAAFRLSFWKAAMVRSIRSPLFGNGFAPYPASIVPPQTSVDLFPSPHNSFVAIAYRTGFIPFVIVLGLLLNLVRKGFVASRERFEPRDRATCLALTAVVVYTGVTSAFNVFLEAPYAGPLFWTCVGLLAYAVYADPFRSRETS